MLDHHGSNAETPGSNPESHGSNPHESLILNW